MKKLFFVIIAVYAITGYASASSMSVQTKIYDANSQPPIVGGVMDNYVADNVLKKGIIVSAKSNDLIYDGSVYMFNPSFYSDDCKSVDSNLAPLNTKDFRVIDCSKIGIDQFWCTLKLLKPNMDYYVRAFIVKSDGSTIYGDVEKVHTQSFSRYNGASDYANVWYAFSYTLFDLMTDEIINPNDGFYYSTNENPTRARFQKGTSYNTCYKYATEWNYKLWYYHNVNHCDKNKVINLPIMTYSNGKLTINKNPLDENKSITIYYSINGNYFRPETYTDVYHQPLSISSPCTVYCYAISSDGYISYTNMYVIGNINDDSNYKSMNDYINESVISVISNDGDYSISPVIRNIKKIYIDLTKGSTNSSYCYLGICNDKDTRGIGFSSKYLNSISTDNFIIDNKRYSIKDLVDKKTFSWLYYNPNNTNEVIIDVKEYFGQVGYIYKWQKNFGTSCIVNIETDVFETSEDYISVSSSKISSGEDFSIGINLENSITDYTAYQFDIALPAGITIATNANGKYMVTKTDRYEDEAQSLNISSLGDNSYRIVSFSMSNGKITGKNGSILNAVLTTDKNVKSGTYEGIISNIIFTKSDGTQVRLKEAKITIVVDNPIVGDTNGDKEVNVSDIVEVINYIMDNPSAKFVKVNADLNGDGEVNVTDVVMMVSIIMSGQYSAARIKDNFVENPTDGDWLTLTEGEEGTLTLNLENRGCYVASQFDLRLSNGQTLEGITQNNDRLKEHKIVYKQTGDNCYKVIVYSLSNNTFMGESGKLLDIHVAGSGEVCIDNILLVTKGCQEKHFGPLNSMTTGIINAISVEETDVYGIDGRLLRRKTSSTNGMAKGVYIINGKKHIVK